MSFSQAGTHEVDLRNKPIQKRFQEDQKQGKQTEKLIEILRCLAEGKPLELRHRDHALIGPLKGSMRQPHRARLAANLQNWLNTSNGHQAAYNLTFSSGWSMTLWDSADVWQLGGENRFRHKDAYYFLPSPAFTGSSTVHLSGATFVALNSTENIDLGVAGASIGQRQVIPEPSTASLLVAGGIGGVVSCSQAEKPLPRGFPLLAPKKNWGLVIVKLQLLLAKNLASAILPGFAKITPLQEI